MFDNPPRQVACTVDCWSHHHKSARSYSHVQRRSIWILSKHGRKVPITCILRSIYDISQSRIVFSKRALNARNVSVNSIKQRNSCHVNTPVRETTNCDDVDGLRIPTTAGCCSLGSCVIHQTHLT